mmetsp:Transcript_104661/g.293320  ORF Transcript_104661/g.293320 Transcript_104661/m.293320 type:complete len:356 (+) Transcript_104661:91-1158(+)
MLRRAGLAAWPRHLGPLGPRRAPVATTASVVGAAVALTTATLGFHRGRVCAMATAGRSSLAPPVAEGMGSAVAARVERSGIEVELVPCLDDNYCPIFHHPASGTTLVVDTPEAAPILAALRARGLSPTHILNTHHHEDHVGGNLELKRAFPEVRILGPGDRAYDYPGPYPAAGRHRETIPGVDIVVSESDVVMCGGLQARVLEVGGHTAGHVAYFFPEVPMVLAGDCLFTMGCGRVFTGDFALMQASLQKLRSLPGETVVYSAHEYTASNAKFALQVEPGNVDLQERVEQVTRLRAQGLPTVPTLLAHEWATNPMLRWDAPSVQAVVGKSDPVDVFTAVRRWKDTGKAPSSAARL